MYSALVLPLGGPPPSQHNAAHLPCARMPRSAATVLPDCTAATECTAVAVLPTCSAATQPGSLASAAAVVSFSTTSTLWTKSRSLLQSSLYLWCGIVSRLQEIGVKVFALCSSYFAVLGCIKGSVFSCCKDASSTGQRLGGSWACLLYTADP
jgi:hypothetical protein